MLRVVHINNKRESIEERIRLFNSLAVKWGRPKKLMDGFIGVVNNRAAENLERRPSLKDRQ